ncbi:MAG: tRNA guanosine(34) transglycosylase Tgt [Chloroflexi bacterium]|nr:tRNA guanosine(34) transglycosylase Tgt [Chloroflexota bacterium]
MFQFSFELITSASGARAGLIRTPHGEIPTPAFMPVGSQGTVKTVAPDELKDLGAKIILGNTYHLYLRPGVEVIEKAGGLHRFMGWDGPILTDSGGFQVFSLGHLRRLSEDGALFRSHIDGSEHLLTPEKAIDIQHALGADIIMPLDECPPHDALPAAVRSALERTYRWAERCRKHWIPRTEVRGIGLSGDVRQHDEPTQALFGIVQGGLDAAMRRESAEGMVSLGFDGYGLGGLSLGEAKEVTYRIIEETAPFLPEDKPRYLMGVGSPEDLVEAVARGIDMFDCVLQTRVARNGAFLTKRGRLNIRNAQFREHFGPIEDGCDCYTCRHFTAAYLHHLFRCEELLAYRLATLHNLRFTVRFMEDMRRAILDGSFESFRAGFLHDYRPTDQQVRLAQKEKWVRAQRGRTVSSMDEQDGQG